MLIEASPPPSDGTLYVCVLQLERGGFTGCSLGLTVGGSSSPRSRGASPNATAGDPAATTRRGWKCATGALSVRAVAALIVGADSACDDNDSGAWRPSEPNWANTAHSASAIMATIAPRSSGAAPRQCSNRSTLSEVSFARAEKTGGCAASTICVGSC